MHVAGLLSLLRLLPEYQTAHDRLRAASRHSFALNLTRAARPPVIAALAEDVHRPVLVLTSRADRALVLVDELAAWTPASRILPFNDPDPIFYELAPWRPQTIRARLLALAALSGSGAAGAMPPIVVASARALMTRTLPRRDFLAHTRTLRAGQSVRLEKLLDLWVGAGYTPETTVLEPGQFARRGGIVDIFPVAEEQPVRLELFGDEVESLRRFDPTSQRSGARLEFVTVTPAREALPRHRRPEWEPEMAAGDARLEFFLPRMFPPASLLEYLPQAALVLVDDWQEMEDSVGEFEEQAVQLRSEQSEAGVIPDDFPVPYLSWSELQDELASHPPVYLHAAQDEAVPQVDLGACFHPGPRHGGQLRPLLERLAEIRASGAAAAVVTRQAQRLAELWGEQHDALTPVDSLPAAPAPGSLTFVQGALAEGWRIDLKEAGARQAHPTALHLFTDAEVFGWSRPEARRRRARPTALAPEAQYADFTPGDYLVHADHGIGRFHDLVRREVDGVEREYLLLAYAGGDELYVPIYQADRLTRYVGADDHPPGLSRLGAAEWQSAKSRAREAVEVMAREMLELYARRALAQGRTFAPDTPWQHELEAAFPYVETEDQLRAIHEVKADLEQPRPMDRLICGDVGYGKTEVALRAAFKAVLDGTQVAILVPTTVLAQQHFHTFQSRLSAYPMRVEMLSRFRSRAEAERIVDQLAQGKIDIIIGTHRLLQRDVRFQNLGLLIIDEEQRFGITHKERLKQMRTEVDVLTLTATPIPRTLYMALTGVRDISTINTPPAERLPIVTHTGPYDDRMVRQAILRELDRGGQVFFVHNRVQSIGIIQRHLEQLVPEARIGVGHGQMDEHLLSQVMEAFTGGEIDLLLCTSIIESGLDIPNANTLIVDRADMFGLAQLYQLRGRVGRGAAQAYAYFLTDRRHRPTLDGRERLETIAEQHELGAGYQIAMRDLEMRGAGDLLGPRQSGHISAIGFHLYTKLLAEAVRRLKGKEIRPEEGEPTAGLEFGSWDLGLSVSVDLPLAASLPADYVADGALRLRLYRRLADLGTEEEVAGVAAELADRFGPVPRPLENLLFQLRVRIRAARAGVLAVTSENGQVVLSLPPVEGESAQAELARRLGPGVRVSKQRVWLGRISGGSQEWREQLLAVLERLAQA